MRLFVIDEDMPRSTWRELSARGWEATDVRDIGLRGAGDDVVFRFAQSKDAYLVTGDTGFGNILKFKPGTHKGIVVVHYPNEVASRVVVRDLVAVISNLSSDDISGNLVIIEPGRTRIRRALISEVTPA